MPWSGQIFFGDVHAVYKGRTDENDSHAHAAYQLVLSPEKAVVVIDASGNEYTGKALLIPPMVNHAVLMNQEVCLVYMDPHAPFAVDLTSSMVGEGICQLKDTQIPFDQIAEPEDIVSALHAYRGSKKLDQRLSGVVQILTEQPGKFSIAEVAKSCGLSESRLRVLTREQLGVPLATWLVWRKLERSMRALVDGMTLVDASNAGGFADQAHFTREMRRMFGITPGNALTIDTDPR